MLCRYLALVALLTSSACGAAAVASALSQAEAAAAVPEPEAAVTSAATGAIIPPGGGDFIAFCDSPHLDVTVKVGSRQNSSAMEMGTARLAAGTNNFGRHSVDEIIYFVAGTGFATVAGRRAAVQPGSSMFVPRGVRHGFENSGTAVMEFVWVTSPSGFERGLRSVGVPSQAGCERKAR